MTKSTANQPSFKSKLLGIPGLGYSLRLAASIAHLPKRLDMLSQSIVGTERHVDKLSNTLQHQADKVSGLDMAVEEAVNDFTDLHNRQIRLDQHFIDIKHQLNTDTISTTTSKANNGTSDTNSNNGSDLFANDHDLDDFYIEFENKFRGTEAEIKKRLKVYSPYFKELPIDFKKQPVLDIGCGRGELLKILKEDGVNAIGMDINESMVKRCNEQGLTAVQAEALSYLKSQKTGSLGAITGFHIVEHIPFNFLLRLFSECYRVLAPGGIVIFETPNPESIHVGSFGFYYDPSHLNPLVPDVLAFAIQNRGFDKVEILRLHPKDTGYTDKQLKNPYAHEVIRRFYMEQDYAVIGRKAMIRNKK